MLQAIFPVSPNSVHPEEDAKGDVFKMKRAGCGVPPCGRGGHCELTPKLEEISDARGWPAPGEGDECSSRALSFVNIDPHKVHSSDSDEEAVSDLPLKELDKEFDQAYPLHSAQQTPSWGGRGPSPRHGAFQRDAEFLCQDGPSFPSRMSADDDWDSSAGVLGDTEACGSPVDCDPETTPTEMVVRPKIRKQTDENPKERRRFRPGGEAGCGSVLLKESPENFPVYDPRTAGTESGMWHRAEADASGGTDEDDFWEDLEGYGDRQGAFQKEDDRYSFYTLILAPSAVCVVRCGSEIAPHSLCSHYLGQRLLLWLMGSFDEVPDFRVAVDGGFVFSLLLPVSGDRSSMVLIVSSSSVLHALAY